MKAYVTIILVSLLYLQTYAQYSIKITPIDSNVFIYTSYGDVGKYKNIDANAVVVMSEGEAMLFDTPWDDAQTNQLIQYVQDSLKKTIKLCIITHAHVDRIGGIKTIHKNNIPTICYYKTALEAPKHDHPVPEHQFYSKDTTLECGAIKVIAYYPGAGHTVDNIVLAVPSKQLLYGGCFIKSGYSRSIGNIADADVKEWPKSINSMNRRFMKTNFRTVVPGHGSWQADNAISNTLKLLSEL